MQLQITINPYKPAQSAQADIGRKVLLRCIYRCSAYQSTSLHLPPDLATVRQNWLNSDP